MRLLIIKRLLFIEKVELIHSYSIVSMKVKINLSISVITSYSKGEVMYNRLNTFVSYS